MRKKPHQVPLAVMINKQLSPSWDMLDVCCGIGNVTKWLRYNSVTGIDVHPAYTKIYKRKIKKSKAVVHDLNTSFPRFPQKYDAVLCVDGVEHFGKERALEIIRWCESMASKVVLIFTPDRFIENHPVNTWGISGGDHHQKHLCHFEEKEMNSLGYKTLRKRKAKSIYGSGEYNEMLYLKKTLLSRRGP